MTRQNNGAAYRQIKTTGKTWTVRKRRRTPDKENQMKAPRNSNEHCARRTIRHAGAGVRLLGCNPSRRNSSGRDYRGRADWSDGPTRQPDLQDRGAGYGAPGSKRLAHTGILPLRTPKRSWHRCISRRTLSPTSLALRSLPLGFGLPSGSIRLTMRLRRLPRVLGLRASPVFCPDGQKFSPWRAHHPAARHTVRGMSFARRCRHTRGTFCPVSGARKDPTRARADAS